MKKYEHPAHCHSTFRADKADENTFNVLYNVHVTNMGIIVVLITRLLLQTIAAGEEGCKTNSTTFIQRRTIQ